MIDSNDYSRDAALKSKKEFQNVNINIYSSCLPLIFHERGILPVARWGQCRAASCSWPGWRSQWEPGFEGNRLDPHLVDSLALLRGSSAALGWVSSCYHDVRITGPGRKIIEGFYRSLPCVGSLNHHYYLLFTEEGKLRI